MLSIRTFVVPALITFLFVGSIGCGGSTDDQDFTNGSELSTAEESLEPKTAGVITDFLWKPKAESDYNKGLLVIHASPCNLDVRVNGESLRDYGPGNGRCVTARSVTTSGCGYGNNAKVEIFDTATGLPYTFPDGNPYYIIPGGCNRYEFKL